MPSDVLRTIGYGTDPEGPFTAIDACVAVNGSINDEPFQSFETLCHTTVRRGHRITLQFEGGDYSDFAALRTLMEGNAETYWELTYQDGQVGVLGPARFMVRPFLADQPFMEVYTAANSVTSDPTTVPLDWTSHGTPLGQVAPDVTGEGDGPDGIGRPYWGSGLWHVETEVRLPEAAEATLIALEQANPYVPVKIAFRTDVADNYLILSNMYPHIMIPTQLTSGVSQKPGLYASGTDGTLANLFSLPATVQPFFSRWEAQITAATTQPYTNIWNYPVV